HGASKRRVAGHVQSERQRSEHRRVRVCVNANLVRQRYGEDQRLELVVAVVPPAKDSQERVDLRGGVYHASVGVGVVHHSSSCFTNLANSLSPSCSGRLDGSMPERPNTSAAVAGDSPNRTSAFFIVFRR